MKKKTTMFLSIAISSAVFGKEEYISEKTIKFGSDIILTKMIRSKTIKYVASKLKKTLPLSFKLCFSVLIHM